VREKEDREDRKVILRLGKIVYKRLVWRNKERVGTRKFLFKRKRKEERGLRKIQDSSNLRKVWRLLGVSRLEKILEGKKERKKADKLKFTLTEKLGKIRKFER